MSETRRNILVDIYNEPKHVSQIADDLKLDRSTISYHLNLLEKVGLVSQEYTQIKSPESPSRIGSFFSVNQEAVVRAVELAKSAVSIASERE